MKLSRRGWVVSGAIAATTVLAAGAVGGMWWQKTSASQAACDAVRAVESQRHDDSAVSEGTPTAVILGDSYTQGQKLDDPRTQAWSTLLGEAEEWETYVNGVGGTGYTNPGPCGHETFLDRIDEVLGHSPEVVVVQGGVNDDPSRVPKAADDLLSALTDVDRVIVVGPVMAPGFDSDAVTATDKTLQKAAAAAGVEYISMLDADVEIGPDRRHMTAAGHAAYADIVAAAIR